MGTKEDTDQAAAPPKRRYQAPAVRVLGNVNELTRNAQSINAPDGSHPSSPTKGPGL
jgi:hypothetical protein